MIPESFLENFPPPLPQVGAVLCLDTRLPGDYRKGGKHWKLAGSCVLVASDRVLTIGHILGEREEPPRAGRYAVFFPYEGLFDIAEEPPEWEPQWPGDNLALVRLKRPMEHWAPLPALKVRSLYKYEGSALVCGYGNWPRSALRRIEGIQQQQLVSLGPPQNRASQHWQHYDNLDLSWSASENHNLIAGRAASGSPMLTPEATYSSVIGIVRETGADQQAGSWIGWKRWYWLSERLQQQQQQQQETLTDRLGQSSQLLKINAEPGELVRLRVPEGATRFQATLNASKGMRLQMGIVPSNQSDGLLDRVKDDDEASGRFLYRTAPLTPGTLEIAVGVCPVARAPRQTEEAVLAQICVLFLR